MLQQFKTPVYQRKNVDDTKVNNTPLQWQTSTLIINQDISPVIQDFIDSWCSGWVDPESGDQMAIDVIALRVHFAQGRGDVAFMLLIYHLPGSFVDSQEKWSRNKEGGWYPATTGNVSGLKIDQLVADEFNNLFFRAIGKDVSNTVGNDVSFSNGVETSKDRSGRTKLVSPSRTSVHGRASNGVHQSNDKSTHSPKPRKVARHNESVGEDS